MTFLRPVGNPGEVKRLEPWEPPADVARAYRALSTAAEAVGRNNHRQGKGVTAEHRMLINAMPDVLAGRIGVDQAMALLHEYDVMQQRFPRQ